MRRLAPFLIGLLAWSCSAAASETPVRTGSHEKEFQQAVELYRAGRYSAAFARFSNLARQGDPDAAHVAVFMNRYGPVLYGSWWDADPTDVVLWAKLIRTPGGRAQPVFVPDPYAEASLKRVPPGKAPSPSGPGRSVQRP